VSVSKDQEAGRTQDGFARPTLEQARRFLNTPDGWKLKRIMTWGRRRFLEGTVDGVTWVTLAEIIEEGEDG